MYLLIIALTLIVIGKLYYKFSCGICNCTDKMINRVVVITGSNTGIGFETAEDLARRGAKVILACRDHKRGTTARNKIIKSTGNQNITFKNLDLASFKSVRAFADDILKSETRLDVLINNAGTENVGNFLTEDNLPFETQVNHFSPFLLTLTLLPLLKSSAPSRIINVSSLMHRIGKIDLEQFDKQSPTAFTRFRVYSDTKLANILFTRKLSHILKGTGVTVNCLHPGAVNTDIFRDKNFATKFLVRLFFRTAKEGAQTSIHLAVSEQLKETTGKYFCECREFKSASHARDDEMAEKLWTLSEEVVSNQKKYE